MKTMTEADVLRAAVAASDGHLRRYLDGFGEHTVTWGRGETTARDLLVRMVFHNGMHTGQIVDLRRALGMPGVNR